METEAGRALGSHHHSLATVPLRRLLAQPGRVEQLTRSAGDLVIDFTRARADATTLSMLCDLADELQIPKWLHAMARGEAVNTTEHRPALHTALRLPPGGSLIVDGVDIAAQVAATNERVSAFVEAVHSGAWRGSTGERIRSVVNIGIGGSDLGPRTVVQALRHHHLPDIDVRFVSNVDPADLGSLLPLLDPATTIFLVVSKTFTTIETLTNAKAARHWLTEHLGVDAVAQHVVAVTAATDRAVSFGIQPAGVFGFWDWVGGRFSLSSPVGLAIELAVGSDAMTELRAGMHVVDQHVLDTPPPDHGALLLGMLDVWYTTYFGVTSKAVVPYSQDLSLLPAHLQQLQMESNGKSTTRDGEPVQWRTSPSVWGAAGTNGQHAFFQMLHQGTGLIPIDFVGVVSAESDADTKLLQANLVAQAAALAIGRSADELRADGVSEALVPHRTMPGNHPSTMVLLPDLSPFSVGQLIALYEHATVVAGLAWGINPFDQWGVELGKQLAAELLPVFNGSPPPEHTDPATLATLRALTQR